MRHLAILATLALAACGELQAADSICVPAAGTPIPLGAYEDDDPKKTTESDWNRVTRRMVYDRNEYGRCWEKVVNEIISMGGTDDAAKTHAADECGGELISYEIESREYNRVFRALYGGEDNDYEASKADVAAFSKHLDLRLEAFKLCHANRAKRS